MNVATLHASPEARSKAGWDALRLTLAVLIAVHGWTRLLGGGIAPFGDWLDSQGLPFGLAIATCVTVIEVIGTLLLVARRFVFPLTLVYATRGTLRNEPV